MTNISQKIAGSLELLVPFMQDYSKKMHASEVARMVKSPQRSVARKLEHLKELKILNYNREGRNKYFFFDLEKSDPILQMVESYKEINFLCSHPKIAFLMRELSRDYSLILFGSHAKGLAKIDSDIDLVIFARKSEKINNILKKYPFEVNVHYVTLDFFKKRLKTKWPLAIEIAKDHILFGDKEKVIRSLRDYYRK